MRFANQTQARKRETLREFSANCRETRLRYNRKKRRVANDSCETPLTLKRPWDFSLSAERRVLVVRIVVIYCYSSFNDKYVNIITGSLVVRRYI